MNQLEAYLVELLQERIDGVYVRREFLPDSDHLPCITLDTGSGVRTEQVSRWVTDVETTVYERYAHVNINVWCNSEEEREYITGMILLLFHLEQQHHYTYCTNYNKNTGNCSYLDASCPVPNKDTVVTIKNKCPDPYKYGHETLSMKHRIIQGSINIEPPMRMDETDRHPPLLRSILEAEASYYEFMPVGGHVVEEYVYKDPLNDEEEETTTETTETETETGTNNGG